uniref:Uncharacterized protein n=1 Tax=Chromera velia CCMP2878 TaxID=1169474 RepID=A0A0G4GAV7_9ALVE|eukprot:Cvel_21078.t1-p1 / transcript=Cvel_21078.t1 / gene=Cvel_21078 / organism=Chromera_velia_CCMP2878 / gene_product=hypothetical protein / transcript_product=hypothetical protein / location=Cvel_scaffold1948:19507-20892(+) / protein_length=296 / sequence_SO=supercontig / SO=protein_coding / is_pseudo=false
MKCSLSVLPFLVFVFSIQGSSTTDSEPLPEWKGTTIDDLRAEYGNIFKKMNRNAASHLWSSFILDRAFQMPAERVEHLFTGFCAVSGSPVRPRDHNRYGLNLETVTGRRRFGFMHYCCWPCVCDTQDFIKVDSKTITTADGEKQYWFAVIGNPCDVPGSLDTPFNQRGVPYTLRKVAPELECTPEGKLKGATLSDGGYVIISMFFDSRPTDDEQTPPPALQEGGPRPGRLSTHGPFVFQHEGEYEPMCTERAQYGYQSGMGEIFRQAASVAPVGIQKQGCKISPDTQGDVVTVCEE